jgi:glucan phosphoethanolaminetransferase (alkaline phosphatase superfamily)
MTWHFHFYWTLKYTFYSVCRLKSKHDSLLLTNQVRLSAFLYFLTSFLLVFCVFVCLILCRAHLIKHECESVDKPHNTTARGMTLFLLFCLPAYVILPACLSPYQLHNQSTGFHETWYEYHANGGYFISVLFHILPPMTTWRQCELWGGSETTDVRVGSFI